jgi:hypothetical protein
MAKNIYLGANVELSSDTFASFIDKTNLIIDDMGKVVVTAALVAQANTANGGQTTGNVHIEGVLSALRMAAVEIGGGSMSAPAPLIIGTDLNFANTASIDIGTNATRLRNLYTVNAIANLVTSNVANILILNANTGSITALTSNTVSVLGTLSSNNNNMFVVNVTTSLSANVVVANTATIKSLSSNDVTANTVVSDALTSNVMTIIAGTIQSLVGNTFNFGSGQVTSMNVSQDVRVTGNLIVSGVTSLASNSAFSVNSSISEYLTVQQIATLNGNTVIGVDGTKTVTINAALASSIIPASNNAIALGSATKRLGDVYANRLLVSNVVAATLSGDGSALTALNGSQITTGTVADARLPSTLAGKTFTSDVAISNGTLKISSAAPIVEMEETDTNKKWYMVVDGDTWTVRQGTLSNSKLIVSENFLNFGSSTVWHSGNDGPGSGLDADLLDGYDSTALPVSTPQLNALNLKANLASPAFTGTPTAPTQAPNNNSTRLATTAYVDAGLVLKAPLASPSFTGNVSTNGFFLASGQVQINGPNTSERLVVFNTNNIARWAVFANGASESGTASGSNFAISRYTNAGAYIDAPLYIERADGRVTVNNLSVNGNINVGTGGSFLGTDGNIKFSSNMLFYGTDLGGAFNLKANLASPSFTGSIGLPGVGSVNNFNTGNADGASYSQYNLAMKGWWGMGMQDHTNTVNGYYDFRLGKWDTKGGSYRNGVEYVLPNGGTYNVSVYGNAGSIRDTGALNGRPMFFNWNGQPGTPDWLWGGVDGQNMYVYSPSNISVRNAAQLGGLAASSYSTLNDLYYRTPEFQSGNQAYVSNGFGSVAHGIGRKPNWFTAELVCVVASNGWAVGDVFDQASCMQPWAGQGSFGIQVWANASTINWRVGLNGIGIFNKSDGTSNYAPTQNWVLRFRAGC